MPDVHISAEEDIASAEENEPGMSGKYLVVRDYSDEYHGELDMKTAFAKSCNHVFAQLAMEVGVDRLKRVAKELGVGDDFLFDDIVTAASSLDKADTEVDLAWSGVGQYTDIMTPLHMCMIAAGVANDGVMVEPKLLKSITNSLGVSTFAFKTETYRKAMSSTGSRAAYRIHDRYGKKTVRAEARRYQG